MRSSRIVALVLVAWSVAAAFAACGGGETQPAGPDASVEGGGSVSVDIGPNGGTVSACGSVLAIPPGALTTTTTISMSCDPLATVPGFVLDSPLYRFAPDGLTFARPATATLAFAAPPGTSPALYWSRPGGGYAAIASSVQGVYVVASIGHFSTGFVGALVAAQDGGPPPAEGGPIPGDGGPDAVGEGGTDSAASVFPDAGSDAGTDAGPDAPVGTADSGSAETGAGGPDAGGSDAPPGPPDAGALQDGCVTPYTPGFVDCLWMGSAFSECRIGSQSCCTTYGCQSTGTCGVNVVGVACDGPEDCDGGLCFSGGCAQSGAGCREDYLCPGATLCTCHSDLDCAGTGFPYCYPDPCESHYYPFPVCHPSPSPDAGVNGSCVWTGGIPDGSVACNGAACATPANVCCVGTADGGTCDPSPGNCSDYTVECDGPEDCGPGMVCCANSTGRGPRSFCTTQCAGMPIDEYLGVTAQHSNGIVCHTVADCGGSGTCKAFSLNRAFAGDASAFGTVMLCYP
jgi:hypothetical protein